MLRVWRFDRFHIAIHNALCEIMPQLSGCAYFDSELILSEATRRNMIQVDSAYGLIPVNTSYACVRLSVLLQKLNMYYP